jgi:hypothetical protein
MSSPSFEIAAAWSAFAAVVAVAPIVAGEDQARGAWAASAAVCTLTIVGCLVLVSSRPQVCQWLCPTEADTRRMHEAGARVKGARQVASAALALTLVVCLPWFGPVPAHAVRRLRRPDPHPGPPDRTHCPPREVRGGQPHVHRRDDSRRRAVDGRPGQRPDGLARHARRLMASRFRRRVVLAGLAWFLLILTTGSVLAHTSMFVRDPSRVLVAVALLVGVTACSLALSENEMQFRQQSRTDPLTGLLNRAALASR